VRNSTNEKDIPMKRFLIATTALTLLVAPMSAAFAQGYNGRDDHRGNNAMMQRHDDNRGPGMMQRHDNRRNWRKGGRIERNDWNRGQRVSDYNRYHLSRPPRGYEWRRVDNNYILAAAATGIIASILLANQ
jgi:Ni/Co efflux regulator RcnB